MRPCLSKWYYSCECPWPALSGVASFSPPLHAVIRPMKQIMSTERNRVAEVFMGMPFQKMMKLNGLWSGRSLLFRQRAAIVGLLLNAQVIAGRFQ